MENVSLKKFISEIYVWMALGLSVSAFFAYLTQDSILSIFYQNSGLFYGLLAFELILVIFIQFLIQKLPVYLSLGLFFFYAALNGISLSGFVFYFISSSPYLVVSIFVTTVIMFTALALYGFYTKKDYSGWGHFLFAAVIGIIISSVMNIFLQSSLFDILISIVALLIFSALVVYDNQFYKNVFYKLQSEDQKNKLVVLGALHMYINFVVMFQSLLSLAGYARD